VVAGYQSGQTMTSLAAEYGVKRESISKLLRREGVEIRLRRQMSQEQIDEAVRLYRSGLSLQQIGTRLGWDHNTIYRHLKKRGVTMRGPNDWQY
jgi:transposase-like protein